MFCSLRSIQMSIFWSYSRKTHFWPFIYIFQRAVTHSKIVRLTRFFFRHVQNIPMIFFLFYESNHFLNIMNRKCQKTESECPETVEKNLINWTIFEWVTALWNMCFSWITPEIFTFEYYAKNQTCSEVHFM